MTAFDALDLIECLASTYWGERVESTSRPCDRCGVPWPHADLFPDEDGLLTCPACEDFDARIDQLPAADPGDGLDEVHVPF